MEEFRNEMTKFYKQNYEEEEDKSIRDRFCPLIKQLCLAEYCSFWIIDANDDSFEGDHPCSINVIGSYIFYEKWQDEND